MLLKIWLNFCLFTKCDLFVLSAHTHSSNLKRERQSKLICCGINALQGLCKCFVRKDQTYLKVWHTTKDPQFDNSQMQKILKLLLLKSSIFGSQRMRNCQQNSLWACSFEIHLDHSPLLSFQNKGLSFCNQNTPLERKSPLFVYLPSTGDFPILTSGEGKTTHIVNVRLWGQKERSSSTNINPFQI